MQDLLLNLVELILEVVKLLNINKALTIDGCGATLDANDLSQIFYITGKGCTIKNIIFKNACSKYGGAIYWNGTSGTLTNCTFINCYSNDYKDGGSVYWAGSNGKLTNCKFIDSYGADNGSSVYWTGSNGILATSTFTGSSSSISGGAIFGVVLTVKYMVVLLKIHTLEVLVEIYIRCI